MIRSFIGLPLPADAIRALGALQTGLAEAREVPAENLHLTLAFLDDQPEAVLRGLAAELDGVRAEPFPVRLSGVTLLGGKTPGAIAVGANGGEALVRLQARVARVVREAGIDLERRRFRPHVTIFRLSKRAETSATEPIQRWIDRNRRFEEIVFEASELALYRSRLSKSGAVYDVLADFPFGRPET